MFNGDLNVFEKGFYNVGLIPKWKAKGLGLISIVMKERKSRVLDGA